MGGCGIDTIFSINGENGSTKKIADLYNILDNMDHNFKMVPQGYRNLHIENDFLSIFGLEEFQVVNFSTTTIPEQPGRSSCTLELSVSNITSKTTLEDPETINQEFIISDNKTRKKVYDIIKQYLTESFKADGYEPPDYKLTWKDKQLEYYNIVKDSRNKNFVEILESVKDKYNQLLLSSVNYLKKKDPINTKNFTSLSEQKIGWIPELDRLQKSVKYLLTIEPRRTKPNFGVPNSIRMAGVEIPYEDGIKQEEVDFDTLWNDSGLRQYQKDIISIIDNVIHNSLYLEQFSSITDSIKSSELNRGKTTYPDFAPQIRSVAALDNSGGITRNLIDYEPDCYLWYPIANGIESGPFTQLLDANMIAQAKQISLQSYDSARGNVNEFFATKYKEKYLKQLSSSSNGRETLTAYKILEENLKDTQGNLPTSIFEGSSYKNASQQDDIKMSMVPDLHKGYINWFDDDNPTIKSKLPLTHSTDFNKLWDGIEVNGAQPQSIPTGNQIPAPAKKQRGFNQQGFNIAYPIAKKYAAKRYTDKQKKKSIPFVDLSLVLATIDIESGFNNNSSSSKGATGMMQLLPQYHGQWGNLLDPDINIKAGVNYLAQMLIRYNGDEELALSAYNMGFAYLDKWRKGDPTMLKRFGSAKSPSGKTPNWQYIRYQGKILSRKSKYSNNLARSTPSTTRQDKIDELAVSTPSSSAPTDITMTVSAPIVESINAFQQSILKGQLQSILRAYPTFKLYFIESDSGEERHRLAWDDFFSYNAIQSIRVVRSKEIAADCAFIELSNISGTLSNRKFRQDEPIITDSGKVIEQTDKPHNSNGQLTKENSNPDAANTIKENPIASLLLAEGTDISLHLGYSADVENLPTVINGKITGIEFNESDEFIQIVCQSYATELVQDIKGIEKAQEQSNRWWDFLGLKDGASTGKLLEYVVSQPEVVHFGRWHPSEKGTENRELLTNKWQYVKDPSDDNIFSPEPRSELWDLRGDKLTDVLPKLIYRIYKTTLWDICQEMTLRHPNFITSVVPYKDYYGERMTLFYGMPNQLYFARHPKAEEQEVQEKLKQEQKYLEEKIALENTETTPVPITGLNGGVGDISRAMAQTDKSQTNKSISLTEKVYRLKRLQEAKRAGYIKPFRNYYLITDKHHIIANNIQTNTTNIANAVSVTSKNDTMFFDPLNVLSVDQTIVKLDSSLPDEDLKTQIAECPNAHNETLRKRYGLALLKKSLASGYKGEIITIGIPELKPYDICFVHDETTDMSGPIEVKQVTHILNEENGFVSEIVPEMVVMVNDWSLLHTVDALSMIASAVAGKANNLISNGFSKITPSVFGIDNPLFTLAKMTITSFATSIAWGGTFGLHLCTDKLINYTQLGHPLIISPLSHHGRPFAGGVPIKKLPLSFWKSMFGQWFPTSDSTWHDYQEEVYKDLHNLLKKITGQYSTGSFFKGFHSNTLDIE